MKAEQIHGGTDLAVVAFFGLFQKRQVRLELLFIEKGRPIYPLQLGLGLVCPPVCTGNPHQFNRAHKTGVRHVRSPAQVGKISLFIKEMVPSSRSAIISVL
jgi:hypothetical protein